VALDVLTSLIWPTYGPHTAQIHSSNGDFAPPSDNSRPLFSMYSRMAEEEDNKTVTRWQRDTDGILIFVGLFVPVHLRTSTRRIYRLDYSLPLFRAFSMRRSKISNPGPKTSPRSTSGKFISVLLTPE
jgi:hypothetical protein